jgi:acetyl esterase
MLDAMTVLTLEEPIAAPVIAPIPVSFPELILEPATRAFLAAAADLPSPPTVGPTRTRALLAGIQAATRATAPAVDVEDLTVAVPGPLTHLPFRILRPRGVTGPLPVILYIHGGGWVAGSAETHDRLLRELAAGTGAAVVVPEYTHAPEAQYPRAIRESYSVLSWVAFHGANRGLDGSRIAIAGDSVGATIATTLTLLAKERGGPSLAAQVLFYPATDASLSTESHRRFARGHWLQRDAMRWFWDQYIPDEALRVETTASPLRASPSELANLPQALIITAEADILRDEGEAYARRLGAAGVNVTTHRYRGVVHDFVMLNALRETTAAEAAISLAVGYLAGALGNRYGRR